MIHDVRSADLRRFRELVAIHLGLHLDDSRLGQLADVLRRRLVDSSLPADAYLDRLQLRPLAHDEVGALARELTIGETYFFRHAEQFRAFSAVAVPDRMQAQPPGRPLRILSAGCASGEEAYTLAILLSEQGHVSRSVSIRAVDINPAALAKAARARYSAWALRETSDDARRRWFETRGNELLLDESVRRLVTFEERNLATADPDLWQPDAYDIVFCRNVLMYFTPENAVALANRIASSLAPGGYLFLGHAETLRGLSQDFHLRHTHGTFYYQRRQPASQQTPFGVAAIPEAPLATAPLMFALDSGGSWVEAIQRASERIHALQASGQGHAPSAATQRNAPDRPSWDLTTAVELLKAERFAEALDLMHALPPEAAIDPDVLLLRATLLTHRGQLAEAEKACSELLAVDELNAGAHYLFALCREGLGDARGAAHHDQVAAYLDPGFAMPRLHMGLLARRAGDAPQACRELLQALELLRREEASRLLLFGGGFTRDALLALCRAEINASGGAI